LWFLSGPPTVLPDYRGLSKLVLFIDREESCIV
jgi:hypothetical protein